MALAGATTLDHCGTGSDGNKGIFRILQSSGINGESSSDFLKS